MDESKSFKKILKLLNKLSDNELIDIDRRIDNYKDKLKKSKERTFYTNNKPKRCLDCPFIEGWMINNGPRYQCKIYHTFAGFTNANIVQDVCPLKSIKVEDKKDE